MKTDVLTASSGTYTTVYPPRSVPHTGWLPSTRVRILGWYMGLLALALVVGLFLQRSILLSQLDDEVNAHLMQEVEEFERLLEGREDTGLRTAMDLTAVLDLAIATNIPDAAEALFTIVDGKPYSSSSAPYQLFDDPALVSEISQFSSQHRGETDTPAGRVRYQAVPVTAADGTQGFFVTAFFMRDKSRDLDTVLRTGGIAAGSIFVIASVLAWFAAGRILRPVRLLTETALSIQDGNWSGRIPVRGNDEIATLASTFNDMLNRLEASFTTQRQFIDDASHELATPITIIRGHLEVMTGDPEEDDESRRLVMEELERMSHLVDDLLLLARSGHSAFLEVGPIDVQEFMLGLAAKASALSPQHEWRLVSSNTGVIVADTQRLTQALLNFARNAAEHSDPGSAITLGSRHHSDAIEFWVEDKGEGISPAEQERIFHRFARGGGRTRNPDGAGLGLAIVQAIAQAHGGSVGVSSTEGAGSRFSILLPLDPQREG